MASHYRSAFWLNLLAVGLVGLLIGYARISGPSVAALFHQPDFSPYPADRLLTHTFQLLCSVPFISCAFTVSLLNVLRPHHPLNRFIGYSAVLTGGFLLNEIFRIHIHLVVAGIPKLVTVLVYALAVIAYGWSFRQTIRKTPYLVLLMGVSCLFTGITIDALKLGSSSLPILMEGIPKLFSEINIALYFWLVCHREVIKAASSQTRMPESPSA